MIATYAPTHARTDTTHAPTHKGAQHTDAPTHMRAHDHVSAPQAALFDSWAAQNNGDAFPGFEARMAEVTSFYQRQSEAFLAAAEKHLTGLADWTVPRWGGRDRERE